MRVRHNAYPLQKVIIPVDTKQEGPFAFYFSHVRQGLGRHVFMKVYKPAYGHSIAERLRGERVDMTGLLARALLIFLLKPKSLECT